MAASVRCVATVSIGVWHSVLAATRAVVLLHAGYRRTGGPWKLLRRLVLIERRIVCRVYLVRAASRSVWVVAWVSRSWLARIIGHGGQTGDGAGCWGKDPNALDGQDWIGREREREREAKSERERKCESEIEGGKTQHRHRGAAAQRRSSVRLWTQDGNRVCRTVGQSAGQQRAARWPQCCVCVTSRPQERRDSTAPARLGRSGVRTRESGRPPHTPGIETGCFSRSIEPPAKADDEGGHEEEASTANGEGESGMKRQGLPLCPAAAAATRSACGSARAPHCRAGHVELLLHDATLVRLHSSGLAVAAAGCSSGVVQGQRTEGTLQRRRDDGRSTKR